MKTWTTKELVQKNIANWNRIPELVRQDCLNELLAQIPTAQLNMVR